jgi:leader peptidase (prepilin peptidase)/N-methyltransferase
VTAPLSVATSLGGLLLLGAFLGASLTSFARCWIFRSRRGLSIVAPRSFCDGCKRTLRFWEILPIIGWILCRGRCSDCGAPIAQKEVILEICGALAGLALTLVVSYSALR